MTDRTPQPPGGVRRAFDAVELPVALQEHFLRQLLRRRAVTHKAQREAEHHRLVLRNNLRERKPHTCYYGMKR